MGRGMGTTREGPIDGPADGEDLMAETRLLGDRYEIGSLLGTGGMASVYLGTDRVLSSGSVERRRPPPP